MSREQQIAISEQYAAACERTAARDEKSDALLRELEAAHDTLDALCMSGYLHLVAAALPDGHGMDTIRKAILDAKG